MAKKAAYRISNWATYNRALIDRGNLTLWISDEVVSSWGSDVRNGRKGRDFTYSDDAIRTALTLRSLLGLTLRSTQGFLEGLKMFLSLSIEIPCYSTFSRRAGELKVELGNRGSSRAKDIVIDATGLKVYGEGEWHVRTHGKTKRRTWRKLHLAIDRKSQEIVAMSLTAANVHDSMETENLLSQAGAINSVTGDKGYDNRNAYDSIAKRGAKAVIPPRSGAALKRKNLSWGDVERKRLITEKKFWGKNDWKKVSRYHQRSLVETGIFRFKRIIGGTLHSRNLQNQQTEAKIAVSIINKMTHLGMPKSYKL
jgi:IS5 family transposase